MNNEQAKFILNAYRPGGRDAQDPACAEALAQARADAALSRWLEHSQAFDVQVAARLGEIAPPPGLREAILAGGKVSSVGPAPIAEAPRGRNSHGSYGVWAAAAAVLLVFGAVSLLRVSRSPSPAPAASDLAAFALRDLGDPGHIGDPDAESRAALGSAGLALTRGVPVDFTRMERDGCRSLTLAGCKVLEVCFRNGGREYHLYVLRRNSGSPPAAAPLNERTQIEGPGGAAAAWVTADYVFALAARSSEGLRRLL